MNNPVRDMILEALAKSGFSQIQIAEKAGISKSKLNHIITGKRRLTEKDAKAFDQLLYHFDGEKAMRYLKEMNY